MRSTWQFELDFPRLDLDENQDKKPPLKLYKLTVDDDATTVWKREYPTEPEDDVTSYWKSGLGGYGVRREDAEKEDVLTQIDISLRPFEDIRNETVEDIKKKAEGEVLGERIKECPDIPEEITKEEEDSLDTSLNGMPDSLKEFLLCQGGESEKIWLLSEFLLSDRYEDVVKLYGDFNDDTWQAEDEQQSTVPRLIWVVQNTPVMKRRLEPVLLRYLGSEFDDRCMEKLNAENDKVSKLSEIVDLIQFRTTNVTEVVEPKPPRD